MSAIVMGLVWELPETPDFGRPEKLVFLAYADHADSNGKNIYPSVGLVSKKTFYDERSTQRITRTLEHLGYLVADGMGPHGTNRWYAPMTRDVNGGVKLSPQTNLKMSPEEMSPEEMSPEPSLVVKDFSCSCNGENFQKYEQEFGGLTPMIADAIKDAEKNYPADWIPEAMAIAVVSNKRSWKYVEGILKNCKAKNIRPSLNKLEKSNDNNSAGNHQDNPRTQPKKVGISYSQADIDAANAINAGV